MSSSVPPDTRLRKIGPLGLSPRRRMARSGGSSQRKVAGRTDGNRAKVQGLSDGRYRSIINSLDLGFCVVEMTFDASGSPVDYKFVEVNEAFVNQTGLDDATKVDADACPRTRTALVRYLWAGGAYGRVCSV